MVQESAREERTVPIDDSQHRFQFTRRWFEVRNQQTFSTFLPPRFSGKEPVHLIQIGVFEGMDLVWDFQNILCHPDSRALAIDPWAATSRIDGKTMMEVRERAIHNLKPWEEKLSLCQGFSHEVLAPLVEGTPVRIQGKTIQRGEWDLIVIDGDHSASAVLSDACQSYQLARRGGWLLFDDVRNRKPKQEAVREGLDRFRMRKGDAVRTVWQHRFCDCLEKVRSE